MSRSWRAVAVVAGLLSTGLFVAAAVGQASAAQLSNPKVLIKYIPPHSAQYQDIYQRLTGMHVLETMQVFLAPLNLPKPISVRTMECGAQDVAYVPGQPVTICYETVRAIENSAPGTTVRVGPYSVSPAAVIIGAFVDLALHKVARAILDVTEVPVWGRKDDASDFVAALVMLQFSNQPSVILTTLIGTSWFLAQRSFIGTSDFSGVVRGADAQRFYNYACMAYGDYPDAFQFLVTNGELPKGRAEGCGAEYRKLLRSFMQTLMPLVNQEKLKQVRALDWPKLLHIAGG